MSIGSRIHIFIATVVIGGFFSSADIMAQQPAGQPKWEQTETSPSSVGNEDGRVNERETAPVVTVRDMYIYVELDQPTSVKLFTILGQPVSQMTLPAGTSRFRATARGIYILKIGASTKRITI